VSGLLRRIRRVHFVGIGGVGMCGIAEILRDLGCRVSGSDVSEGPTVTRLRALGIEVGAGHDAAYVGDADVVVVSSAIRPGNPEVREAERLHVPVIPRAEMLAEIMRVKEGIAVAGTHGKTTTTSLIAHVLTAAGLDPTAVIGGRVRGSTGDPERLAADAGKPGGATSGARLGRGELMVAEADESDGSFLRLAPVLAVVTNIEPEHLDHWGSEAALHDGFADFANKVPFFGAAILCLDDPGVQQILPRLTRRAITYGFSVQAEWVAGEPRPHGSGMRFQVRWHGEALGEVQLPLPGRHNVQNALATLAVAREAGVSFDAAAAALEAFGGVERRFEVLGSAAGVRVVDDYGHHPTEIRATLAAARDIHPGRIVVVFQPHRYSRTRDLFDEFATAFHDADRVWVTEIYAAGEDKIPGIEATTLVERLRARGHRGVHLAPDLTELPEQLAGELRDGDLVITLGAGSITRVGPELLRLLAASEPQQ
jgi:UDP-N-acetylmuramate--alanine ligase